MTSSQCSVPGDVQGQTESPHASSRPPPGPPLPEPSVGEVAPEALPAQSEGVGSVSIQQGLGSAAWVGSAGGQESGGTREGSTSGHPPVATGPQTSSADEASTLHPEGPGTIDRAPSNEAIMVGDPLGPSSAAGAAAAPGDAELMAWEAEVRGGANDALPLVGELEAMEGLAEEYAGGARVFRDKILWLAGKYGALRRTRGDGNCFFRSFVFALLEQLLLSGDLEEKDRCARRVVGGGGWGGVREKGEGRVGEVECLWAESGEASSAYRGISGHAFGVCCWLGRREGEDSGRAALEGGGHGARPSLLSPSWRRADQALAEPEESHLPPTPARQVDCPAGRTEAAAG